MSMLRRWFDQIIDPDNHAQDTDGIFSLFRVAGIAIIVVFIATIWLGEAGDPGPWGDFFGGFLNPILTFVTFMGVLATILLQHRELKETRAELAKSANALSVQNEISGRQLFESSFFQMLSLHNDIVGQIDLSIGDKEKRGRDCFNNFLRNLGKEYASERRRTAHLDQGEIVTIKNAYEAYWRTKSVELGHYYRYLFNVVRYVVDSDLFEDHHGKLLRAQLSDQELVLLFYNTLTERGRAFEGYAVRIDIFDNLNLEMLLDVDHHRFVPRPTS